MKKKKKIREPAPEGIGWFYRIFQLAWPIVKCLIVLRRAGVAPGLALPERKTLLKGDDRAGYCDWWKLYVWGGIRRVLDHGHGGIATFAAEAGLLYLAIIGTIWKYSPNHVSAYLLFGLAFGIGYALAVLVFYIAYVSLREQTPKDYANTMLSGKTVSEILKALAHEMYSACESFKASTCDLNDVLRNHVAINDANQEVVTTKYDLLTKSRERFENQIAATERNLQRLMQLQEDASHLLGIPASRLRDHILQYSPSLHLELTRKYGIFWSRILEEADQHASEHFAYHTRKCTHIWSSFAERSDQLRNLFGMHDLHGYVHRIASKHSTSGAILEYASGLSHIADAGLARLVAGIVPDE